jgi:hypothetical protein
MELHLKIIGYTLVILAFIHAIFPKYFNWKEELASLSLINKQMMEVHTFFVAFTVFLIGLLCISSTNDLINSSLGQRICLGFSVFWGIRFLFQFFVYSPKLWKGKTFETTIHILASIFWAYLTIVFFLIS